MWYKFNFLQICMFLVPLSLVPVLTSPYARVSNNFLIKNVRSNGIFQVNYTAGMVQRVSPSKSPRGSLNRQVHSLLSPISCEVVRGPFCSKEFESQLSVHLSDPGPCRDVPIPRPPAYWTHCLLAQASPFSYKYIEKDSSMRKIGQL